ncbi:MAG: hypothetical protein HY290_02850 [Planctomycetia bacterium]|nr:hypothetical protein [Planctomycetia bacterium]
MNGAVIVCTASSHNDNSTVRDDEIEDDSAANPGRDVWMQQGTIDQFILGTRLNNESPAVTFARLEARLNETVAAIDGVCTLTPEQRNKLTMAGRGDIKHFLTISRLDHPTRQ